MMKHLTLLFLACLTTTVQAQPRATVEGVHYQPLANPVPTETNEDVIEVREIFWYGCPECFTLEPMTTTYQKGVRGDVKMLRTPAVWNDIMATHARLYFTAVAVDAEEPIHQAAFAAIHKDNNPLRTQAQIKTLFAEHGISEAAFESAWNSEEVTTAVQQARLRTSDYGVEKLPSMIVGGRYRVTENAEVSDHIELNIAVNNVIRKLRDERRTDF